LVLPLRSRVFMIHRYRDKKVVGVFVRFRAPVPAMFSRLTSVASSV
jgi:hypothetical protein